MNVRVIFLCELVAWCAYIHNADSLHFGGCYGHWFHLFCKTDSRIALDNLYVIAMTLNCSAGGPGTDTPTRTCCETDMDAHDCKMNYIGDSVISYHEACSGRQACDERIAHQDITCGLTHGKQVSNYMTIDYHCVEVSGIVLIPSNDSANESTVSIQTEGYPTSGINASAGICSVTASHNSSIDVSLLHLNITCQQYIDILDGSFREKIGCGNNTNYSSGILYTSRNHVISLIWTFNASVLLWIQFTATNSLADLELRCVSSSTTPQTSASTQPISTMMTPIPSSPETSASSQPISTMVTPIPSRPETSASSQPISTMVTAIPSLPETSASSQPISTTVTPIPSLSQTSASSQPISKMVTAIPSRPETSASSQPISTMVTPIPSFSQTSASSQPISTMVTPITSRPETSASSQPISTMVTPITSSPQTSASSQPISTMMTPITSSPQTSASSQPISTMIKTSNPLASGSIQPKAPSHLDTTTLLISTPRGGMSLAEAAGVGVGVVVSVLVLLILVCFLHKKKHQRVKVGNHGGDVLDSEFADALGITRANMGSTAPVSVILPKPRRLAPIEVPGTGIHL